MNIRLQCVNNGFFADAVNMLFFYIVINSPLTLTISHHTAITYPFTIGIIENNAPERQRLKSKAESMGHPVVMETCDSAELIEHLTVFNPPPVIFINAELPGTDGFDVSKFIKRHWPAVKVIIFSILEMPVQYAKAVECGADYFISKKDIEATISKAEILIEQ